MRNSIILILATTALAGCDSSDPADGGLFNGLNGIASGDYQERVDDRQDAVDQAETRNAALSAEQKRLAAQIGAARNEVSTLKLTVLRKRQQAGPLPAALNAKVERVLNAPTRGKGDAAHLAALQQTIANARALSAELSNLSG